MASGYFVAALAALAVITCCILYIRKREMDCLRRTIPAVRTAVNPNPRNRRSKMARSFNSMASVTSKGGRSVPNDVLEALADPNTHLIGVHGSDDETNSTVLQAVRRRAQREKLFDMVLTATVTKKPDVNKIQGEIAGQLGFNFTSKSKDKRASELRDRITNVHQILIILCGLHKRLDLGKVGIPYGADHRGCKILLTSVREEVLSTQMHTQRNFMV